MVTYGDTHSMSLHRAAAIPAEFTFPGSCYADNHQGLSRQGPDIEGVHGAAADCTASISCRGLQTCGDHPGPGGPGDDEYLDDENHSEII